MHQVWQKAESRGQRTEGRGQKAEGCYVYYWYVVVWVVKESPNLYDDSDKYNKGTPRECLCRY